MMKRMLHSSRGIFVTCVVITNLLSSFITAFIWLNVSVYLPENRQPQSPLLPMLISTLVAIPISSVVSKRSAKPLQDMVKATQSISKGDYSVRVEESGAGDVYELLHSFNQMTAELGSTEMMRNDFINTFSHEFKTPIVSIRGFAKRLKNENLSPEKRKQYLEYIAEESEQLSNLASSVLLIARYDNQKFVAERSEYDLDEQLRNCVLRMETVWSAKNITFEVDLPKLPYVNNVEMMEHVWMNLISNAIKFSHDGGRIFISSRRKRARPVTGTSHCSIKRRVHRRKDRNRKGNGIHGYLAPDTYIKDRNTTGKATGYKTGKEKRSRLFICSVF